jgi:small nuclear ribonucleoprotein (snRNP)-like protein
MNLILSDVEETIMLVDAVDGAAPSGQGVVNVSLSLLHCKLCPHMTSKVVKRKMEMLFVRGDGVILVRTSLSIVMSASNLLLSRYHPLRGHDHRPTGHVCPVPRAFVFWM